MPDILFEVFCEKNAFHTFGRLGIGTVDRWTPKTDPMGSGKSQLTYMFFEILKQTIGELRFGDFERHKVL